MLEGDHSWGFRPPIVADGDDVVVVLVSDDAVFHGFRLDTAGQLRSGPPTRTGVSVYGLGGVVRTPHGWFDPVAWYSDDGTSWTTVPLPSGASGRADDVAVVGDYVVAVGRVAGHGAVWSSADGGADVDGSLPDDLPDAISWNEVAVIGEVSVVSGVRAGGHVGGGQVLVRSTGAGTGWREVRSPPPPAHGENMPLALFTGGGQFFALASSYANAFVEPQLCYADIDRCRQGLQVAVYASDDGDRWRRIDTTGIGEGAGDVAAITETDAGRVVALRQVPKGIEAWTWTSGVDLPAGEEPVDPTADVELLAEGATPELGRRYAVPLYVHCGMGWLFVGGEPWQRVDGGADVETGAAGQVPDQWPIAQETIFGFATLVEGDRIEYSLADGRVIATYAFATEEPPGCD